MPDPYAVVWAFALIAACLIVMTTVVSYARRMVRAPLGRLAMGLFSLSQILVVLFVTWSSWRLSAGWHYALFISVCGVACAIVDPLVFQGLAMAEERAAKAALEHELEEQLQVQERHLGQALAVFDETRQLRESLVELFAELSDATAKRDVRCARNALGKAVRLVPPSGAALCANPAIDALLGSKIEQGREQKTRLDVRADVSDCLGLPIVEVCAVLSNLVDNALSAVRALPVEERAVEVSAVEAGGGLAIVVRNRLNGAEGEQGIVAPRGTSSDVECLSSGLPEHGWGLSIVELIAERHGGSFSASVSDGWFEARVLLLR